MTAQLLKGVSHQEYHSDSLPGAPRLSRSIAVKLLDQSPFHAYAAHPLLGGAVEESDEETEERASGSLIHELLLGGGLGIAVCPYDSWRTNASKDARDEALSNGLLPVLEPKYHAGQKTVGLIRKRVAELDIDLATFEPEITALWESGGVACKSRSDLLSLGLGKLLDIKITTKINEGAFDRSIRAYGLDIQAVAYAEGVAAAHPELAGRIDLEFLVCERKPPYDVMVKGLSPAWLSIGETRWARAKKVWKECLASSHWPGWGIRPPAEPRPWDLQEEFTAGLHSAGEPGWVKGE